MNNLVVIIEDDRDILDMMKLIIEDEGFTVEAYTNLTGMERVIEMQPAVVLLDYRLQDGYSDTFCFSLKSNSATTHIPIVIVSASAGIAKLAVKCKADAYLAKPFDLDDLVAIVKHFVEAES